MSNSGCWKTGKSITALMQYWDAGILVVRVLGCRIPVAGKLECRLLLCCSTGMSEYWLLEYWDVEYRLLENRDVDDCFVAVLGCRNTGCQSTGMSNTGCWKTGMSITALLQ